MSYKDRYGVTRIKDERFDHLDISWDYWDNEHDLSQRKCMLLYIPDTTAENHNHIELDREQATVLRDWLTNYLEDV